MVKHLPANAREVGSIPGSGSSPGGGNGSPLQYSCLENPVDRGAWRATAHGVAESDTPEQLSTHTRGSPAAQTASPAAWARLGGCVPQRPRCSWAACSAGLPPAGGGADSAVPAAPAGDLGHPHLESRRPEGASQRPEAWSACVRLHDAPLPKDSPSAEGRAGQDDQDRSGCGCRATDRTVWIRWTFQNGEGLRQVPLLSGMVLGQLVCSSPRWGPQGVAGRGGSGG